ncbi:uncharacterized protein [Epargyreus clarus]|uniref:uncharacterized protein n=1 Tax=Epargyreus clarus TaxID=520877 RepID=UPI003C2F5818
MSNNDRIMDHENVNGVNLTLKLETRDSSPKSLLATVSYKSNVKKKIWPVQSLILAILFNILALCFVRISIRTTLIILIVLAFIIFFWVTHSVQSESILVIPTVGIQLSVKYVVGKEDHFVPWPSIDDVIINEVIKLNRVLYFLTILVKVNPTNQETENIKLIPLFKYTKPRLPMLERIYTELQALLSGRLTENSELASGDRG